MSISLLLLGYCMRLNFEDFEWKERKRRAIIDNAIIAISSPLLDKR
jgi:hypothetical protein